MSDDENCDKKSPTSSDCEEEDLMALTRIVKRCWEDDAFEKTQSSNPRRWRGRDPDHEIAFKPILKLKDKIESRDSIKWSGRAPEHNMALRVIKNLQEQAQSCSTEEGVFKTRRVQCYMCLKKFFDKDAFRIHFSYVHLRKMYKCTVEGCFRMFSSEPLRNRHSYVHHSKEKNRC